MPLSAYLHTVDLCVLFYCRASGELKLLLNKRDAEPFHGAAPRHVEPDAEMSQRVKETIAPHRAFLDQVVGKVQSPLDRATSLEASMDNVLLDAIAAAGYTAGEYLPRIAQGAALVAHNLGQGRVIGMTDNPVFRGYFKGSSRLLVNAMYLSHGFSASSQTED